MLLDPTLDLVLREEAVREDVRLVTLTLALVPVLVLPSSEEIETRDSFLAIPIPCDTVLALVLLWVLVLALVCTGMLASVYLSPLQTEEMVDESTMSSWICSSMGSGFGCSCWNT